MKYRGSSKIKRKHEIILGLEKILKKIEEWPEVQAINPGEIKPRSRRMGGKPEIKVQYKTESGLKCIAISQGVQEIFIVTGEPEIVREKIKSL